jgi:hypothetical protein
MTDGQAQASALLDQIAHRWSTEPAAVVAAADEAWPAMSGRAHRPEDAETCRQVMLAANRLGLRQEASVWKVRASIRFASCGWPEGVAATLISEFYLAFARANDFFESGTHLGVLRASADAQAILDELRAVGEAGRRPQPFGPDGALLMRLAVEKTGLMLTLAGELDRARVEFQQALAFVGEDRRGDLKVRASLALLSYLSATRAGGDPTAAAQETLALARSSEAARFSDIGGLLEQNGERMQAGRQDLLIYENL